MSYYIISFSPEQMKQFQRRFTFLNNAIWIKKKKDIAQITPADASNAFFFIQLTSERETTDELVLSIRDGVISAKIIYIVEDGKGLDLKSHQMTPVGGDAYISMDIEATRLYSILDGFMPSESSLTTSLSISPDDKTKVPSQNGLEKLRDNSKSKELEKAFQDIIKTNKPIRQNAAILVSESISEDFELAGEDMSDKELTLDDPGELELSTKEEHEVVSQKNEGLELDLSDDIGLELSDSNDLPGPIPAEDIDLDLGEGFTLDAGDATSIGFSMDKQIPLDNSHTNIADHSLDFGSDDGLSLSSDLSLDEGDSHDLSLDIDLSDDAKMKMDEIDAIMVEDASKIDITLAGSKLNDSPDANFSLDDNGAGLDFGANALDSDIDTSLVSDDLDLESINFSLEDEKTVIRSIQDIKKKPKETKVVKESRDAYEGGMGNERKEISSVYSGDMERTQATISNLRVDREELLTKIQKFEEERVLQNRQNLTMRAELDEKKIELTIVRKKLNEEISDLKERLKLFDERKMLLEEKNKIMAVELDKVAHKNKIDIKKVQMRERELEQRLELLKADSDSQIRHRDLKILELKRKLDAMEFDIESISVQEKRSVESRFELEDKLDKAIKTLRNAITVLEDEPGKSGTLEALKKNIDM